MQEHSAQDDFFLKNLAESLVNIKEKILLIHQPINKNKVETWFYTKRISAKLSESLVGNLPFSAEHKNLFFYNNGLISNKNLFYKNFQNLNVLVINPAFHDKILEIPLMIHSLKAIFEVSNVIVFTSNILSPLGASEPVLLETHDKISYYQNIYPEEAKTFDLAQSLLPVFIANPLSTAKILKRE